MDRKEKEKDLWGLLGFDTLIVLACLVVIALNLGIAGSMPLKLLAGILPLLLIIFHAMWTLGAWRGLGFLALSALIGFGFEVLGVHTGIFGRYVYHMDIPAVLGVPILVTLYWAVFTYIGYSITTSFLYWSGWGKPSIRNSDWWLLAWAVFMDGVTVTAIDLFMDPLQVKLGSWSWLEHGSYLGIPLRNFAGWFMVTIIITALFRIFEFYHPRRLVGVSKKVYFVPLCAYIVLASGFMILSLVFRMSTLTVLGSLLMLAVVALNLAWYEKRLLLRNHERPLSEIFD